MGKILSQKHRAFALLLNMALAWVVHRNVSGHWQITGETADAWLVGIFAYWILALVSSPFFSPPKDALANGLGAFIALLTISVGSGSSNDALLNTIKIFGLFACCSVIAFSLLAIFALSAHRETSASRIFYRLANEFGRGELIFTPVVLISTFAGYSQNLPAILSIVTLWILAISIGLSEFALQFVGPRVANKGVTLLGRVKRFDNPGLVRVLLDGRSPWKTDRAVVVELPDKQQMLALPLFEHPGVDGRMGTAVLARPVLDYTQGIRELEAHACDGVQLKEALVESLSGLNGNAVLAGIVVEGSSIGTLRFEAISDQLAKGQIVSVRTLEKLVFYQISEAMTGEESLNGEIHGRRVATAIQLGLFEKNRGFLRFDWVPRMNSCVFVVPKEMPFPYLSNDDQLSIGTLPGTVCNVYGDIDQIVHYHAAVLGVTGTGKTELSLDLVRAAVERNCKVVCVDFTGEYAKRLSDLRPVQLGLTAKHGKEYEDAIFAVESGQYGAGPEKAALKKFVDEIRPGIEQQVDDFLSGGEHLSILELSEITNTKATLRTTELYLSAFMSWAKENRRRERILLVLEEAHTIVPETGGSGMDYDSKWVVDRIGQIALQGRKYGIGLLIVSQRTALVSKTILSQCNTFFTFSLVDQTSLNFLSSVFSTDHVAGISNLQPLEMICYGRGVNSARPILVKREFDARKAEESKRLDAKAD